ncbi:hypothetical protein HEP81_08118 (plasmid) [Streptomyces griseofuscus]|uniref:Uncharacterized protein n=1 Tax=Streptomyces griseofuscus TaxID=146922 RepID=A0A7H1QDG6_9ACTN|nr:hypothetical protein HEP81_08118 [Streptomyces griseofuscus]
MCPRFFRLHGPLPPDCRGPTPVLYYPGDARGPAPDPWSGSSAQPLASSGDHPCHSADVPLGHRTIVSIRRVHATRTRWPSPRRAPLRYGVRDASGPPRPSASTRPIGLSVAPARKVTQPSGASIRSARRSPGGPPQDPPSAPSSRQTPPSPRDAAPAHPRALRPKLRSELVSTQSRALGCNTRLDTPAGATHLAMRRESTSPTCTDRRDPAQVPPSCREESCPRPRARDSLVLSRSR